MKVEIHESKQKFPFVGRNNDLVVLFVSPKCGTVLISDDKYVIGTYRTDWFCDSFTPIRESVVITN